MIGNQKLFAISLSFLGLLGSMSSPAKANSKEIGEKGATVYCFMRESGNNHEVSWKASYEIIKRQKSSLFKTSPKHGAVMIIETVVKNPDQYNDCGKYLGDLLAPPKTTLIEEETETETVIEEKKINKGDRYSF